MRSLWLSLPRIFVVTCGLLFATGALAEPYPTRAIRIVVPYAPGGNSDLIARALAARMSEGFGQPVIIENRPGGSAIIGSDFVAKAPPDGYTLLMISSGISRPTRRCSRTCRTTPFAISRRLPMWRTPLTC
jgi:tripartite-type tricarboxylate transporter receptor subunit TctC